jgi:predicted phosphodiesterase
MKFEEQLAIISDIHGNSLALKSVIEDINNKQIKSIVNLGDSLYGPLDPTGTAEILINLKIPSVCGNEDRILITHNDNEMKKNPSLTYAIGSINLEIMNWLRKLPKVIEYENMILFHGTPTNDSEYFIEFMTENGVLVKNNKELKIQTSGFSQEVILCGHSHIPRSLFLDNGKIILNPGSVGLQAYRDNVPSLHNMETGTPDARYSILSRKKDHWEIEEVLVQYDWNKASSIAMINGRPDWAKWLKYGHV